MPRNSAGVYTLPAGNPVVTNTVITPVWANPTMSDIAQELTNSLDRQGRGGMLAPFKFLDGTIAAPGITWINEPTSGWYRAGLSDFRFSVGGVDKIKVTGAGVTIVGSTTYTGLVRFNAGWVAVGGPLTDFNVPFAQSEVFPFATGFQPANRPPGANYFVGFDFAHFLVDYKNQFAFEAGNSELYVRAMNAGAWGAWQKTPNEGSSAVWTGTHTFKGVANLDVAANGVSIGLRANFPVIELLDTASPADTRRWEWIAPGSGNLHMTMQNDAGTAGNDWMRVNRTGINVTSIEYGNTTNNPAHNFYGSAGFNQPIGVNVNTNGSDVAYFTKGTALANGGFYGIAVGSEYGASGTVLLLRMTKDGVGNNRGNISTYNAASPIDLAAATVNYVPGGSGTPQEIGFRGLRHRVVNSGGDAVAAADNGRAIILSGGAFQFNLGAMEVEFLCTIFNNDTAAKTIAPASGTIYWFNGGNTDAPAGARTLAVAGVATVWRNGSNWYMWGTGIS